MIADRANDPRRAALEVLNRLPVRGQSLDGLMERAYEGGRLDRRDRNLLTTLVYGVLRWRGRLDWIIAELSTRPLAKIHPRVLNILRLALFQLLFLDRVPEPAAVDTAVGLARATGAGWAAGYVNALLRAFLRNRDGLHLPEYDRDPVRALAVRKSLPRWLARRWIDRYGLEEARALADTCNRVPPLTLRANTLKATREALMEVLSRQGCTVEPAPRAPQGIVLTDAGRAVAELPAFKKGLFQVQDEAAQLVGAMPAPQPGQRVLDACAGRGGKTGHLAQLMKNRGAITAVDNRRWRLAKLEGEMKRLGVTIVRAVTADLTAGVDKIAAGPFDRVLVDAPCSGLGVLRRNPDIRWTAGETDLARQGRRQIRMLHQAARLVARGGRLVFAVCSLEPEENEEVVQAFLKRRPDFRLEREVLPDLPATAELIDGNGFLKTFPHRHGMDGFFAAAFRRDV